MDDGANISAGPPGGQTASRSAASEERGQCAQSGQGQKKSRRALAQANPEPRRTQEDGRKRRNQQRPRKGSEGDVRHPRQRRETRHGDPYGTRPICPDHQSRQGDEGEEQPRDRNQARYQEEGSMARGSLDQEGEREPASKKGRVPVPFYFLEVQMPGKTCLEASPGETAAHHQKGRSYRGREQQEGTEAKAGARPRSFQKELRHIDKRVKALWKRVQEGEDPTAGLAEP